jgi:hypothetical protein
MHFDARESNRCPNKEANGIVNIDSASPNGFYGGEMYDPEKRLAIDWGSGRISNLAEKVAPIVFTKAA